MKLKLSSDKMKAGRGKVHKNDSNNTKGHAFTSFLLSGLIIEIDGQSYRQRKHREYGAILLVEMGGSYRLREKMMD